MLGYNNQMNIRRDKTDMINRRIDITYRLCSGESLNTVDIAKEYNVSPRTSQRDFSECLRLRLPLENVNKQWRMRHDALHHDALTQKDIQAIEILESMANEMGDSFSARTKKLLSTINNSTINAFYTNLSMEDISAHALDIALIESAISAKKMIAFDYEKAKGLIKQYEEAPLKIMSDQGFWYLVTYDTQYEFIKKYHLKSTCNFTMTNNSYEVSKDIKTLLDNAVNVWFDDKTEPYEVRLHVSKNVAKYFYRKAIAKSQKIEPLSDGSIEVLVSITHENEILPIVKNYMPEVVILEPEDLKMKLESELRDYLNVFR